MSLHGEVVVEVVVEVECLLDVLGIAVGKLDARLLPPEKIRNETDEAGLRKFVGVMPHGVVDAPDFHDGDDRWRGSAGGYGQIGPHLAVAKLDLDVLRSHLPGLTVSEAGAHCRRECHQVAVSAASRPRTPRMVSLMRPRPCSASNGASVANRQCDVPKNA